MYSVFAFGLRSSGKNVFEMWLKRNFLLHCCNAVYHFSVKFTAKTLPAAPPQKPDLQHLRQNLTCSATAKILPAAPPPKPYLQHHHQNLTCSTTTKKHDLQRHCQNLTCSTTAKT
jgi:hypothetical protein